MGNKGQEINEWYAKSINQSSINLSVAGQWNINQSTGHYGLLKFEQNAIGQISGTAAWNGNLNGTISGNNVEFTIAYPGNVTGLYKGTLNNNGLKISNGTTQGSNGVRATWDAIKGNPVSIAGQWNINQSTGHYGTLSLQQNANGEIRGSAAWNGNLNGTITGRVSGNFC